MQEPLPFIRNAPDSGWEQLYWYFVQAEENREVLTSVKIQQVFLTEAGEMRDLDTVRWYMYRYWRWFLFCINDRVKPYQYRCEQIKGYPLDYFIQAHTLPNRMQYFAHFVRSIETDKQLREERAKLREQLRQRDQDTPVQHLLPSDDQQETPNIPVDTHEEEEGPLPAGPTTILSSDTQAAADEGEGVQEYVPQAVSRDAEKALPPPVITPEEESLMDSSSRPLSPLVFWGIILVVCCALGMVVFILKRTQQLSI